MAKKKFLKPNKENRLVIDKYLELRKAQGKSKNTIEGERYVFERFGDFLRDKHFKDATEQDMLNYFKDIDKLQIYNLFGIKLISFYRWLLKLKKKERPQIMDWFQQKSKKDFQRQADPEGVKKYFISPEEYQTIINACEKDRYGMYPALWETFYLSGGRLSEIRNMKICDVIKMNGGENIKLRFNKSKTKPRTPPLAEYPKHLIRWLGNHPDRDKPNAPLFISLGYGTFRQRISGNTIQQNLAQIRYENNLKESITPHAFRKTRATIMINQRSPDGGRIFTNKQIADFFGWSLSTVVDRMEEYDLNGQKELEDLIFGQAPVEQKQDYDTLKAQNERLEDKYQKKIAEMDQDMHDMKQLIDQLMTATTGQPSTL